MSYYNAYNPYQQNPATVMRQPYTPSVQTYQPPQNGIIWVNNEREAAEYMMAPNSAVALFDYNEAVVYQKQTDASGRQTMRVFDLTERGTKKGNDFVTRQEWEEFLRRQDSLRKEAE